MIIQDIIAEPTNKYKDIKSIIGLSRLVYSATTNFHFGLLEDCNNSTKKKEKRKYSIDEGYYVSPTSKKSMEDASIAV